MLKLCYWRGKSIHTNQMFWAKSNGPRTVPWGHKLTYSGEQQRSQHSALGTNNYFSYIKHATTE